MRPSAALRSKNKQIDAISKFFSRDKIEKLARETKFVQRRSPLSGLDFLMLCVFSDQQCDQISLEGICCELIKENIEITKQSLQERFNDNAVEFISTILDELLSLKLNLRPMSHPVFKRIVICDSTQIQLPESFCTKYRGHGGGASSAGIKIQYGFDLISQKIIVMLVQQAVQPDHRQELQGLKKDDLRIEDLGYFCLKRFKQIKKAQAFFLSRLKFNVTVFELFNDQFREINLVGLSRKLKPAERRTINAFIGKEEKLPVRLIVEKVSSQLANEKRRKLKTDKQNKRRFISKNRLLLCNLNVYITNTTEEQIPAEQIRIYYSLRWQIEIMFKAWKSTFKIDSTKPMKLQRFECMHMGKLILIVLTTNLMAICRSRLYVRYDKELSELKFFKLIKSSVDKFKEALADSKRKLNEYLVRLEKMALRNALKETKIKKLSPFEIINSCA